jgi:hypothetical protein
MDFRAIALVFCLAGFVGGGQAALLSDLVGGASLVENDIIFDNFFFEDFSDTETPFPGDRPVSASEIDITTSSQTNSVTLTASIDPAISISGTDPATGLEHLFEFFLDFSVAVTGSSRTIVGIALGDGDLFATGTNGFAEVIFDDSTGAIVSNLEIFEDASVSSQTTDTQAILGLTSLGLEGFVNGETNDNATSAGLSTFALRFDLEGTPPTPPGPGLPLPGGLWLLLGGLASLLVVRRRRHG